MSNQIAGIKQAILKYYKTDTLIPAVERLEAIERASQQMVEALDLYIDSMGDGNTPAYLRGFRDELRAALADTGQDREASK